MVFLSHSKQATQKYAAGLARVMRGSYEVKLRKTPKIIALEGDLGAGKTTFVQGFTRALGIKERVASPTFILMNIYELPRLVGHPKMSLRGAQATKQSRSVCFKHLVHIDCYRIESPDELLHLALDKILKDPEAIVLIEWADRIRALLPEETIWIQFRHGKAVNERIIEL